MAYLLRRNPALWRWYIYAVVAEVGPTDFVVKIGATRDPPARYITLLQGIAFPSIMLYAPVASRTRMFAVEKAIHHRLDAFRVRGEWFRFSVEERARFHAAAQEEYLLRQGEPLSWLRIKEADIRAAASALETRKRTKRRAKVRRERIKNPTIDSDARAVLIFEPK